MRPRRPWLPLLLTLALCAPAGAAPGGAWRIDDGGTLFAVLTHKAGFASGLAHDHLVVARQSAVAFELDPDDPASARLTLSVRADALEVDGAAARERYGPRLVALGALGQEGLPPVPEKDAKKVREAMLGSSQLDAARYPEIRAELVSLAPRGGNGGAMPDGWTARVRLAVRGRTIERDLALRWSLEGERLKAEGIGEARFTDLGIEPYSAFLGAVKNTDAIHLYVAFEAVRSRP